MTDHEKLIAREEYFEQYRQASEQFTNVKKQMKHEEERFNQIMYDLQESSEELHQRLNSMRRIITFMLDNGCDPVEARLKIEEQHQRTLWNDGNYSLSSIGAMGAVGSASTNSYNGMITVSSASAKLRV